MTSRRYATGQDWYIEQRKPVGGFAIIHHDRLLAVWDALLEQKLQLRDVRVWLACHELKTRRCQAGDGRIPDYGVDELQSLVGGTGGKHLRTSLKRLSKLELLDYSEQQIDTSPGKASKGRLVPVPRRVLRLLAKSRGRAFIATVLGHLIRCLFYRKGTCRSGGWCKASWIAETFGVAIRAVKEARRRVVAMGIFELLDADQIRLNRLGRPVVVRLAWGCQSAPPKGQSTTDSAPLTKHKKLSYRRSDHQKPAQTAGTAGVCKQTNEPDLNNVTEADLEDPIRIAALFKQARRRGLVCKTEANILNFYAAAQHALRVATKSAPGLFFHIIHKQAWHFLGCCDEDKARLKLRKLQTRL